MDRRNLMLMLGVGAAAAALPLPKAQADPAIGDVPPGPAPGPGAPGAPVPAAANPGPALLFADEFNGPAGAPPDPAWWFVVPARENIKNPVFWDRPENMGQYRDDREHVFMDGNGNLVIRATRGPGDTVNEKYAGGKVVGLWRG